MQKCAIEKNVQTVSSTSHVTGKLNKL